MSADSLFRPCFTAEIWLKDCEKLGKHAQASTMAELPPVAPSI
jgi:hypothetical protein